MLRKIGVQDSDHIGACYTGKVLGCTSAQQKQKKKSLKNNQKKIKANKQKVPEILWKQLEGAKPDLNAHSRKVCADKT